ncbi:MAG: phosphatase PAP2 family protein [Chloroflexi bacterium]|nr:phosphatase PAP2 family protein [Chloroflexota bacterium]
MINLSVVSGLALIFLAISEKIWLKEGFAWDLPITLTIYSWRRPWVDTLMYIIGQTGAGGAVILVMGLILWFWQRRRWLNMAISSLGIIGAVTLNHGLTFLFERPRPAFISPLVIATSYDFPSGRTISAAVVYGMLAVFLWRKHPYWALVSSGWIIAVAISQIYRGVHPPSDVLASLSIGLLWLFCIFAAIHWSSRRQGQVE